MSGAASRNQQKLALNTALKSERGDIMNGKSGSQRVIALKKLLQWKGDDKLPLFISTGKNDITKSKIYIRMPAKFLIDINKDIFNGGLWVEYKQANLRSTGINATELDSGDPTQHRQRSPPPHDLWPQTAASTKDQPGYETLTKIIRNEKMWHPG